LGAEADINVAAMSGNSYSLGVFYRSTSKQKWFGSGRLRAGYSFGRLLPFITGGFAVTRYDRSVTQPDNYLNIPLIWNRNHTYVGWTLGAGFEYAFTNHWSITAEYRYADYGTANFKSVTKGVSVTTGNTTSIHIGTDTGHRVNLKTNDIRLGVNYRF
jgi:outer membrane immunogenic protein